VSVTAPADATVKKVYSKKGATVADTVASRGALLFLSLDAGGEYDVTAPSGTISSVLVSKGDTVSSGDTLLTIEVRSSDSDLKTLRHKRASYIDLLAKLKSLQTTKCVYAMASGEVGEVNVTENSSLEKTSDGAVSSAADTAISTEGAAADTDYDNEGVAFTVLSDAQFSMEVSVDELDIASVAVGQEASVEVDALEGQAFSGEVTEVDLGSSGTDASSTGTTASTSSSSGGSYPATIVIEKVDGMYAGMSATATIIKEKRADVLTVPLAAVQEYGDQLYVYTAEEDDGTLGGATEIETGLSDGANTEVTSGLSEGQTVYYMQTESDSSSGIESMRGMPSGGMDSMPSGGMPSGGQMPPGAQQ
jgi:multidrug efflux pump subunit AcrA (membrane-fusion protein)